MWSSVSWNFALMNPPGYAEKQYGSSLYTCFCSMVQLKPTWIIKINVLQKTILKQIRKWIIHCFPQFAAVRVFCKTWWRLDRSLPTRSCRNMAELALCFPLWAATLRNQVITYSRKGNCSSLYRTIMRKRALTLKSPSKNWVQQLQSNWAMGKGRGFVTCGGVFLQLDSTVLKNCKNITKGGVFSKKLMPETREVGERGEHVLNTHQRSRQLSKAEQCKRSWRMEREKLIVCLWAVLPNCKGNPGKHVEMTVKTWPMDNRAWHCDILVNEDGHIPGGCNMAEKVLGRKT